MLTANHTLNVQRQFGSGNDGSCFLVHDSSMLRKISRIVSKNYNSFKAGNKNEYIIRDKETRNLKVLLTIDKCLINNELSGKFRARVFYRLGGTEEERGRYLENKIPYSDVKTHKVHYIVEKVD